MKLPSLFVGHGSPMIALEDSQITENFKQIGDYIIDTYGNQRQSLPYLPTGLPGEAFVRMMKIQDKYTICTAFPKSFMK